MDPVFEFMKDKIGLGGLVLLIAVFFICYVVWKVAEAYTKKTTEINNLPCNNHEKSLQNLTENLDKVNNALARLSSLPCDRHDGEIRKIDITLAKIEASQDNIYRMMQLMASQSPMSQLTQSHSPISLTDKGKEVAQSLSFEKVINDNWNAIASIIDDEKNPYDIQMEFISTFITDFEKYIDAESIDRIKKDAFNRGLPLIEYMRMLGVMARDKYFAEHGIDVSEVDTNDPSKN